MRLGCINSIEQGTGNPFLIFRDQGMCTGAGLLGIAVIATWTRIHCCDQLNICRKRESAFGTADGDNFVLHRLVHDFEHGRAKFRKLIQKQNTPVSK